ncbi:MAG: hypothetical protein E7332_03420 [Clostridiales bacterium]|nr:hypothetical protein [Clostridiales bacterium]
MKFEEYEIEGKGRGKFTLPEKKNKPMAAAEREKTAADGQPVFDENKALFMAETAEAKGGFVVPEKNLQIDEFKKKKEAFEKKYRSFKEEFEAGKTPEAEKSELLYYIYEILSKTDDIRQTSMKLQTLSRVYDIKEGKEEEAPTFENDFLWEMGEEKSRSFTIPAKKTKTEEKNTEKYTEKPRENRYQILAQSVEDRFMNDALRYLHVSAKEAPFVAFRCYLPTFDRMDERQLAYYLYWRSEAKKNHFLKTSEAYIELYAYEIINNIGFFAEEGFDELVSLYLAYRADFPKLDQYFPGWLLDYTFSFRIDRDISEYLGYASQYTYGNILDRILEYGLKHTPLSLNYAMISLLSDYDPADNKFYAENEALFHETIPKLLILVDSYLEKKQGKRVFELYQPRETLRDRTLFQNAVFCYERLLKKHPYRSYVADFRLREFITQFMRASENALREKMGYRSKLRAVTFDPELKKLITSYLIKDTKEVKKEEEKLDLSIRIDKKLLIKAEKDIAETIEMLSVEDTPKNTAFTEKESALIAFFAEHGGKLKEEELYQRDAEFILTIDSINEKTLYQTGRLLLVENRGIYTMNQLDLPELKTKTKLEKQAEIKTEIKQTEPTEKEESPFSTEERAYIAAALRLDEAEMERIAEAAGSMPELFEEAINDKAMELYGDILIESGMIIEDYQETALRLTGVL